MTDTQIYLITWTTYGTWLPGDARGWKNRTSGWEPARPQLEAWCHKQMTTPAVLLNRVHRSTVEQACRAHCSHRGWEFYAVAARSNHVHVVVGADVLGKTVRDQFKAWCTRALRTQSNPLIRDRTWTRAGDIEIIRESDLEQVTLYLTVAQDRKGRDEMGERDAG